MKDYYKVLGVPRDATEDDIRKSFRELASIYHTDVNKDPQAEEKFKNLSEAFAVLSKSRSRNEYDKGFKTPLRDVNVIDINPYFEEYIFPKGFNFSFEDDIPDYKPKSKQTKEPVNKVPPLDEIYLPENDFGLISALMNLYSSHQDGEWFVKPSDRRDWMPKVLYKVRRSKGNVEIERAVNDFRPESEREKMVSMRIFDNILYESDEKYPKDHLFDEKFLVGIRKNDFYAPGGLHIIPYDYGKYLKNIKLYAQKIAVGDSDYAKELNEISEFSKTRFPTFLVDSEYTSRNPHELSRVRKYQVEYLPAFIKDAEDLVEFRRVYRRGVEGARKIS